MKKIFLVLLILINLCSCGKQETLPLPEVEEGVSGDLGIDKNINESTIDNYLNRSDSVYRDMRMLIDPADYEAIGGDSYLSGFVEGFEVVPFPYICDVQGLPEEVGSTYTGETLFNNVDGVYQANYEESMDILEELFPKDKYIFLMCGGGGYAGMMRKMLIALGWDENKIYNVGGYWYYEGNHSVDVKYEEDGKTLYNFSLVNIHKIDFDDLTSLGNVYDDDDKNIDNKIENTNFIKLKSVEELNELENSGKTFPLFVYLSGCSTCKAFLPIVEEYADNKSIQMYCIDLNDIWKSTNSVTERISRAPSMFIYKDGEVIAYLSSDSDDDYAYYKNVDNLSEWFDSYIDINEFDCLACTIK